MTPEQWREAKGILADAMEQPPEERRAFVERHARDTLIRDEVLSLVAAADSGDSLETSGLAGERDSALTAILQTALGQQYEIVRPLGRGGMGAVYLARERALERFVAIKVLRPDLASAPDSRERFRREARIAAQLSHPSILPLHTFGEVHGIWYFVMGYVRGVTLGERLRVEGKIPADEAYGIVTQLADALECAHKHGVVHRDIKPANILLDEESGRAMLADFGISKVKGVGDSLTATGVVIGTPYYMSPEQSMGAPTVDERSDIYSLGAVAYAMMSGREPFADVPPEELTYRRLSADPIPLRTIAPTVSEDVSEIVMRCLARDPAARWPTARSLRDAMARASGDAAALLPETLRGLPTFGPYALIWATGWSVKAFQGQRDPADLALLLLIAILIPVGFLLHIWDVGRHGLDNVGLARVAFWPPEWWGMWWPRALRRPNDIWSRLPWIARAVRVGMSLFIAALPVLILFRTSIQDSLGFAEVDDARWFIAAELALVAATAVMISGAAKWARRQGLTWPETTRLLLGATTPSPAWNGGGLSRLVAPVGKKTRTPRGERPAEYLRAIIGVMQSLPRAPGGIAADVTEGARLLVTTIENGDAEIGRLSREASANEVERLTNRLIALEGNEGSAEHRQLAALVRQELDVLRRMRVNCEVLSRRRADLFALLRGIWTQVDLLEEARTEADVELQRDRLRDLCREARAAAAEPVPRASGAQSARE